MSTKYMYFTGLCKWAKLQTPDEYNGEKKWKINVYLTKNEQKQFKESGLKLKLKEDDDGVYVTFSRPLEVKYPNGDVREFQAPEVIDAELNPIDTLIGNGSTVTAKVEVFDSNFGIAHRLDKVRVDNLVKYEAPELEEGEF